MVCEETAREETASKEAKGRNNGTIMIPASLVYCCHVSGGSSIMMAELLLTAMVKLNLTGTLVHHKPEILNKIKIIIIQVNYSFLEQFLNTLLQKST